MANSVIWISSSPPKTIGARTSNPNPALVSSSTRTPIQAAWQRCLTTITWSQRFCVHEERTMTENYISSLQHYGYTEQEARFLALAAPHSGYFTARQYEQFLGVKRGGTSQRLIEKLLSRRHALSERYQGSQVVYHIRGKGIYHRLGQSDNRNRRDRAPFTIKRKLMCLDFVLAHVDQRFLNTEREKVEYFTVDRQVDIELLPSR